MTPAHRKSELMQENLRKLSQNPYPGRGIVQGVSSDGKHVIQIYWIMGRSENSRNRVFGAAESGRVYTAAADPAKVKDPSLIIYNAMLESAGGAIVSNGDQTDTVDFLIRENEKHLSLEHMLRTRDAEPDEPNFTPRITALYRDTDVLGHLFEIVVIRHVPEDGREVLYHRYEREALDEDDDGIGRCVTTYMGDGDPLPSFQGEPILMPLIGTQDEIADTYWNALNPDNRISLAVKFIPIDGGDSTTKIVNKYEKV